MLCIFQEDIERVSICAIDIYFTEHVKLYIIAFGKFLNLFIWTWFLSSKLVARESKDTKTFFSIPVSLRIKTKKIIRIIICLIFNIFEFLPLLVNCNELTRITYCNIFLGHFCPRGKGAWGYCYVKHQQKTSRPSLWQVVWNYRTLNFHRIWYNDESRLAMHNKPFSILCHDDPTTLLPIFYCFITVQTKPESEMLPSWHQPYSPKVLLLTFLWTNKVSQWPLSHSF